MASLRLQPNISHLPKDRGSHPPLFQGDLSESPARSARLVNGNVPVKSQGAATHWNDGSIGDDRSLVNDAAAFIGKNGASCRRVAKLGLAKIAYRLARTSTLGAHTQGRSQSLRRGMRGWLTQAPRSPTNEPLLTKAEIFKGGTSPASLHSGLLLSSLTIGGRIRRSNSRSAVSSAALTSLRPTGPTLGETWSTLI